MNNSSPPNGKQTKMLEPSSSLDQNTIEKGNSTTSPIVAAQSTPKNSLNQQKNSLEGDKRSQSFANNQYPPEQVEQKEIYGNGMEEKMMNFGLKQIKNNEKSKERDAEVEKKQTSKKRVQIKPFIYGRERLNVSLVQKQRDNEERKLMNPKELELKIKQIAKEIRKKVKKDKPKIIQIKLASAQRSKMTPRKDISLLPLQSSNISGNLLITVQNGKFDQSSKKVDKLQNQVEMDILPATIARLIVKKDILAKVYQKIEENDIKRKNKLKLDPIKHRYPITSFRRRVLEEEKSQHLIDLSKEKQRQQKLRTRKQIFQSSRYQRYTRIITKNNKNIDTQRQSTVSKIFQTDSNMKNALKNPQQPPEQGDNQGNKKDPLPVAVAQLDDLIKKMNESNQSYVKKDASAQDSFLIEGQE